MSAIANILIAVVVIAVVVTRQARPRRFDTERRFWVLPLILAAYALHAHELIDQVHQAAAVGLLAVSILTALAMGCVWGWTVRIWRDENGVLWTRGTKATIAAWFGMLVLRLGFYGLGSTLHVHQSLNALLLSLAGLLLVRSVVVNFRARAVQWPPRVIA